MKRILGLAAFLGKALTGLATSYGFQTPQYQRQYGVKRQVRQAYRAGPRPKEARWWHDNRDVWQGIAQEAAMLKRQRRTEKLKTQTLGSWNNPAHTTHHAIPGGGTAKAFIVRLNPFYQRPVTE